MSPGVDSGRCKGIVKELGSVLHPCRHLSETGERVVPGNPTEEKVPRFVTHASWVALVCSGVSSMLSWGQGEWVDQKEHATIFLPYCQPPTQRSRGNCVVEERSKLLGRCPRAMPLLPRGQYRGCLDKSLTVRPERSRDVPSAARFRITEQGFDFDEHQGICAESKNSLVRFSPKTRHFVLSSLSSEKNDKQTRVADRSHTDSCTLGPVNLRRSVGPV